MTNLSYCMPEVVCYANDNDALNPELWAREGLAILNDQMVVAQLVNRDYSPMVAKFGDTVNCHRPSALKMYRKTDSTTTLVNQDVSATNVPVKLDQWGYSHFTILDGEQTLSFKDLVSMYLGSAMQGIAVGVDRCILGRMPKFLGSPTSRAGRLQNLASSTSHETVLDARNVLNENKAPTDAERYLILNPASENALLKNDLFVKANERGDGGVALENARLGRIYGFDTFWAHNVPYCNPLTADAVTGTLTGASAAGVTLAKASTGLCDGFAAAATKGCFFTVAGDDQPKWMTDLTTTGDPDTHGITANEALKNAVDASAVVTYYPAWTIHATALDQYHTDKINIPSTSYTNVPQVGQMVAFGDTAETRVTYTIVETEANSSDGTDIWLDRPLENAVLSAASAFPGPAGAFNMAFHRNAIALISRPLALPPTGAGTFSAVGVYNGIAMRVSMEHSILRGGTYVACEILYGIKELDANLGVVMLG